MLDDPTPRLVKIGDAALPEMLGPHNLNLS